MASKPKWQAISKYRSYSVDEAARALGVSKKTVRRWIKAGLPTIDNKRPMLVHGGALIHLGNGRRKARQKLLPGEFFCFGCRAPRTAMQGEIWVHGVILKLRASYALRDLIQNVAPCLNVHFEPEAFGHAKATSEK